MSYAELEDMERDPKELNTYTEVAFEDVFGEPDHIHSIDCSWSLSRKVFNASLYIFYIILSTLCALPAAFCCGMKFACLTFESVWCSQPARKAFSVWLVPVRLLYSTTVRCLLDPFMDAVATCLQKAKTPSSSEHNELA